MANFDQITPRRGTSCVKWDCKPPFGADGVDIIPLWVADMDFPAAPCIRRAVEDRAAHGVFGYACVSESYYKAVTDWFSSRHGFEIDPSHILYTTGVVPAISAVLKALTAEGDGVAVLTPVYNCFFSSIRNIGCKLCGSPLRVVPTGASSFTYEIDYEDLERQCERSKVLLFCNPHNPACRVWTREELSRVAEIASRHGVVVVSDEIHNELVMPGHKYTPFACVMPQAITLCSSSKSFNIAGLQIANIVCPDAAMRAKIDKVLNIFEICDVNPFGIVALQAAYSAEGAEWLRELNDYILGNYNYLKDVLSRELPDFPLADLEGTYLAWLSCAPLEIPSAKIEEELLKEEKVWVNAGTMYGAEGFIRINLASPRSIVVEGVSRMIKGLKRLKNEK